jgi:hypothetical protein
MSLKKYTVNTSYVGGVLLPSGQLTIPASKIVITKTDAESSEFESWITSSGGDFTVEEISAADIEAVPQIQLASPIQIGLVGSNGAANQLAQAIVEGTVTSELLATADVVPVEQPELAIKLPKKP